MWMAATGRYQPELRAPKVKMCEKETLAPTPQLPIEVWARMWAGPRSRIVYPSVSNTCGMSSNPSLSARKAKEDPIIRYFFKRRESCPNCCPNKTTKSCEIKRAITTRAQRA